MDAKAVFEFLNFLGAGRENIGPRPTWRPNELQYASVYYGLGGEDVIVRNLFKRVLAQGKPGRYVDVGCAWPSAISNTYYLYTIGWRGLAIDANKAFEPMWAKVRPEDGFIWGAASDGKAQLYWSEHKSNLGASMVRETDQAPSAEFAPGVAVPSLRLDEVFDRYIGAKPINFMNIDVEKNELSVLRSNDWSRWRPDAILVECWDFSFDAPYADPAVAYLREHGYRITHKVGENVLMAHEDAKLGE